MFRKRRVSSNTCNGIPTHADGIFFPIIRELLKLLVVLPIGSTEAERSFSCLRRLHTWLRLTTTTDRVPHLSVIAKYCNTMDALETDSICRAFVELHPRRMTEHMQMSLGTKRRVSRRRIFWSQGSVG